MFRSVVIVLLSLTTASASAAVVDVAVNISSFSPAEVTVRVGDSVRWTLPASASGGGGYGYEPTPGMPHNVRADNGAFSSGEPMAGPWQFSHTFTAAGDYPYYCEMHGEAGRVGMSGIVRVQSAGVQINEGMSGAWYNPPTTGQGFFFDVHPGSNLLGLAWFTWTDQAGAYDWLTGVGHFAGPTAQVTFSRTTGGQFNLPTTVTSGDAGTATITFTDCAHARITFALTAPPRTGAIDLVKLLPVSPLCTPPSIR